ncbi:hypothetical protein BJY59DRAFT_478318 [Rhodotorula toruloides]
MVVRRRARLDGCGRWSSGAGDRYGRCKSATTMERSVSKQRDVRESAPRKERSPTFSSHEAGLLKVAIILKRRLLGDVDGKEEREERRGAGRRRNFAFPGDERASLSLRQAHLILAQTPHARRIAVLKRIMRSFRDAREGDLPPASFPSGLMAPFVSSVPVVRVVGTQRAQRR